MCRYRRRSSDERDSAIDDVQLSQNPQLKTPQGTRATALSAARAELVWQVARPWTTAWIVLLIVQGILPAAIVYLTKLVVDGVVVALSNGGSWPSSRCCCSLLLLGGVLLLMEVVRNAINWVRTVQAELLQDHITSLIHEKSVTVISRSTSSLITTITCIARVRKLVTGPWRCSATSARCCKTASRSSRWARF